MALWKRQAAPGSDTTIVAGDDQPHGACPGIAYCRRSSCLVAVWFWRDFGGALLIRRSRLLRLPFPHFLWAQFVPVTPETPRGWPAWKRFLVRYVGRVWAGQRGYLAIVRTSTGTLRSAWIADLNGITIAHMVPCPKSRPHRWLPPVLFRGCVRDSDDPHGRKG